MTSEFLWQRPVPETAKRGCRADFRQPWPMRFVSDPGRRIFILDVLETTRSLALTRQLV